jgi:hypothetical protein
MQNTVSEGPGIASPVAAPVRTREASGGMPRTGRAISGFVALFMLADGVGKLGSFGPHIEGSAKLGYAAHLVPWIGLALVVSTLLYVVPRTAILGAILVTGYLGGATATQVRAEDPWFLFPVVFGVLAWGGLYLRDPLLRALIPLRGRN